MKAFIPFLLLFSMVLYGQNSKVIQCQIMANGNPISEVKIIDLVTEKETVSDANGKFSLNVQIGDVLVFSSPKIEYKRKIINEEDLLLELLTIEAESKAIALKEVVIDEKAQANSKGIRIMPNQKTYTPAERKLRTATTGILDAPLNYLSGRTKQLKKNIAVEKKERLLLKTSYLYPEKFYIESLKIPKAAIKEFQYHLIEDPEFVKALESKNKMLMVFHCKRLALIFNKNKNSTNK